MCVCAGTYGPPLGFSFDETSTDEPMQDDVGLEQYNVGERVNDFVKASLEKASFIQGNNIMWMFGNDFNYQYAAQNYQNMDKLLRAVNADGRIIAFYSTPARYVEAKLSEVQQQEEQGRQERQREGRDAAATADEDETTTIAYPVKRDDFFPYADQPHAYWTGYFTSRPTQKFYNKYASAYLQTARQIQLLGMVSKESSTAEREHHFAPPTDDPMAFVAPNEPSVTAPLSEALGLSQHHDAVTGTAKQHVASDWARRIGIGMDSADAAISDVMRHIVMDAWTTRTTNRTASAEAFSAYESWLPCHLLNVSHCDPLVAMKNDGVVVLTIFNTLGRTRTETIKLPMPSVDDYTTTYVVIDKSSGNTVPSRMTLLPGTAATALDTNVEFGRQLEFQPTVPALGAALFEIRRQKKPHLEMAARKPVRVAPRKVLAYSSSSAAERSGHENVAGSRAVTTDATVTSSSWSEATTPTAKSVVIENEYLRLHVSGDTGHVLELENKETGVTAKFEQDFAFYKSYASQADMDKLRRLSSGERETSQTCPLSGDADDNISDKDSGSNQNSGAYIFRNNGTIVDVGLSLMTTTASKPVRAPESFELLQDLDDTSSVVGIVQRWSDYIYQTISLSRGARYVEFEYKVGPIPVDDYIGKEIVTRYRANIMSNGAVYTDSNGRSMVERNRNARASYDIDGCKDEPVSCNYYPVTTAAYIKDSAMQLTVMTDRAQGAASLTDGELEFMLHRRILVDDGRGVAEPLNETDAGMSGYPDWKRQGDGIVVIGRHRVLLGEPGKTARDWKPAMQSFFSALTPLFGSKQQGQGQGQGQGQQKEQKEQQHYGPHDRNDDDGGNSRYESPGSIAAGSHVRHGAVSLPSMLLSAELPPSVDVMTLQAISASQVLLRIQHMYEEGEAEGGLSDCIDVDVGASFAAMKIKGVTAMSLTNNQKKVDMRFPTWGSRNTREGAGDGPEVATTTTMWTASEDALVTPEKGSSFTICPMEVHTFVLDLDV